MVTADNTITTRRVIQVRADDKCADAPFRADIACPIKLMPSRIKDANLHRQPCWHRHSSLVTHGHRHGDFIARLHTQCFLERPPMRSLSRSNRHINRGYPMFEEQQKPPVVRLVGKRHFNTSIRRSRKDRLRPSRPLHAQHYNRSPQNRRGRSDYGRKAFSNMRLRGL